jgi:hypothetical protein
MAIPTRVSPSTRSHNQERYEPFPKRAAGFSPRGRKKTQKTKAKQATANPTKSKPYSPFETLLPFRNSLPSVQIPQLHRQPLAGPVQRHLHPRLAPVQRLRRRAHAHPAQLAKHDHFAMSRPQPADRRPNRVALLRQRDRIVPIRTTGGRPPRRLPARRPSPPSAAHAGSRDRVATRPRPTPAGAGEPRPPAPTGPRRKAKSRTAPGPERYRCAATHAERCPAPRRRPPRDRGCGRRHNATRARRSADKAPPARLVHRPATAEQDLVRFPPWLNRHPLDAGRSRKLHEELTIVGSAVRTMKARGATRSFGPHSGPYIPWSAQRALHTLVRTADPTCPANPSISLRVYLARAAISASTNGSTPVRRESTTGRPVSSAILAWASAAAVASMPWQFRLMPMQRAG